MSIYGEALPPEQEPYDGAGMARLALYGQLRHTLGECDARGQAVDVWTDEYVALVCAGMQNSGEVGRPYFNGIVRLLGYKPDVPNVYLLYGGRKDIQRKLALRGDVFEHPEESAQAEVADTALRRTIACTVFTIGRAREFAERFQNELMPAKPFDPVDAEALLEEYPKLAGWQQYGKALIRMRSGLIPPLSDAEAQKYAIGTDSLGSVAPLRSSYRPRPEA